MKTSLYLLPSVFLTCIVQAGVLAIVQSAEEETSVRQCPEKLSESDVCLLPSDGALSTALLYSSELEAAVVAGCYAVCVQNSTEEVSDEGTSLFHE